MTENVCPRKVICFGGRYLIQEASTLSKRLGGLSFVIGLVYVLLVWRSSFGARIDALVSIRRAVILTGHFPCGDGLRSPRTRHTFVVRRLCEGLFMSTCMRICNY